MYILFTRHVFNVSLSMYIPMHLCIRVELIDIYKHNRISDLVSWSVVSSIGSGCTVANNDMWSCSAAAGRCMCVVWGLPDHPPTDQTLTIITLFSWKLTQFLVAGGHSVFRSLMRYL